MAGAGPGGTGFAEGDRVWCNSMGHGGRQGSFAREVVVAADRLYPLPPGVDPVAAVAVLHTAGTAWLGLFREARLGPADTIVVGGGAGGVGSAVVQLAAAAGADVVATAADGDAGWCRSCGARAVVDHRDPDHLARLRDAAPRGVDVYWDTSGHQDLEAVAPLLARGARVILTAASAPASPLPAARFYTNDVRVLGFAISNATVADLASAARVVNARLADGTLRPRIGATVSLSYAAEAHRLLEDGRTRGRIVVMP